MDNARVFGHEAEDGRVSCSGASSKLAKIQLFQWHSQSPSSIVCDWRLPSLREPSADVPPRPAIALVVALAARRPEAVPDGAP
jgi:hypothetical protein